MVFEVIILTSLLGVLSAEPTSLQRISDASNNLGFEIFRRLPRKGNLVTCPLSTSIALGMVYLGAGGGTEAELRKALGYARAGLQGETVHAAFSDASAALARGGTSTLRSANAIMLQKGYGLNRQYRERLLAYYKASADEVDFTEDGQEILLQLNEWVRQRTDIATFLKEPFETDTRVALLNAVHFHGKWKTRFDERITIPDTFYADGRVPKTVPMMQMKQKLPYDISVRLDSYILALPYASGLTMILLLPRERTGLANLESVLTPSLLYDAASDLKEILVQVALPRFKIDADDELIPALRALGVSALFDTTRANLTSMAKRADGLSVTRIVSKTIIDVNEQGTTASGVTGVSAGVRIGGPLHDLFRADHPFLFFIRDDATNIILFMGRVTDP